MRVCLADQRERDWAEEWHSFRGNLKYAEVLSLYLGGDTEILQRSNRVGQSFSLMFSSCVCRVMSDVR